MYGTNRQREEALENYKKGVLALPIEVTPGEIKDYAPVYARFLKVTGAKEIPSGSELERKAGEFLLKCKERARNVSLAVGCLRIRSQVTREEMCRPMTI